MFSKAKEYKALRMIAHDVIVPPPPPPPIHRLLPPPIPWATGRTATPSGANGTKAVRRHMRTASASD